MEMRHIKHYFQTACERYSVMLAKEAGDPKPWTEDAILQSWKFCNVHREDDRTTRWFRENIRDPLVETGADPCQIVESTIIFRWFNRIETGEMIRDLLIYGWDEKAARERLTGVKPLVTGAFIVKTPDNFNKLEGLLEVIREAVRMLHSKRFGHEWYSLEQAWTALTAIPFLGPFMSYEVVSDLRWTPVLSEASDIMTWANPGPGCTKGISRVLHGHPGVLNRMYVLDRKLMFSVMREILEMTNDQEYWPETWRSWEMREVEHWACEYDKYCRVKEGERIKQKYDGGL